MAAERVSGIVNVSRASVFVRPTLSGLALALLIGCGGGEKSADGGRASDAQTRSAASVPTGMDSALAVPVAADLGPDRTVNSIVRVGDPSIPFLVAGQLFRGAWETAEPVRLSRPVSLEFYPLHISGPAGPARLLVTLFERDEPHVLYDGPLYELDPESASIGRRTGLLGRQVRLDLSRWAGRRVGLRWDLPDTPEDFCLLADMEFRPLPDRARPLPDVLLICSDTHRTDRAPGGGVDSPLMPSLVRFASASVTYSDARSNASWTLPSIASAMTGLPPAYHRTGLRVRFGRIDEIGSAPPGPGLFAAPWTDFTAHLSAYPAELVSLPEALLSLGYSTALVAANPFYFLSGLHADGFNFAFNLTSRDAATLNENAFALIDGLPKDRPLFLSVHYIDVHDFKIRHFKSHDSDMEAFALSPEDINAIYDDAVREYDSRLGRLIEKWDSVRGGDSSLVIFYSDHGEHLMDPGSPDPGQLRAALGDDPWADYRINAAPILGHGNSLHETLLRVPLVIRYPKAAGVGAGTREGAASLVDIMPTVLDVAGAGRYLPAGETPDAAVSLRLAAPPAAGRPVHSGFQLFGNQMSSVSFGGWKLVRDHDTEAMELIDLNAVARGSSEPDARTENKLTLDELSEILERHEAAAELATSGLESGHEADPEEVTRDLRKLGYIR